MIFHWRQWKWKTHFALLQQMSLLLLASFGQSRAILLTRKLFCPKFQAIVSLICKHSNLWIKFPLELASDIRRLIGKMKIYAFQLRDNKQTKWKWQSKSRNRVLKTLNMVKCEEEEYNTFSTLSVHMIIFPLGHLKRAGFRILTCLWLVVSILGL